MFTKITRKVEDVTGSPIVALSAFLLVVLWFVSGPFFSFSATWQLFINTTTTIITFLMVFFIQSAQNTDTKAIHTKLDEIILSIDEANNAIVEIEKRPKEIAEVRHEHETRSNN